MARNQSPIPSKKPNQVSSHQQRRNNLAAGRARVNHPIPNPKPRLYKIQPHRQNALDRPQIHNRRQDPREGAVLQRHDPRPHPRQMLRRAKRFARQPQSQKERSRGVVRRALSTMMIPHKLQRTWRASRRHPNPNVVVADHQLQARPASLYLDQKLQRSLRQLRPNRPHLRVGVESQHRKRLLRSPFPRRSPRHRRNPLRPNAADQLARKPAAHQNPSRKKNMQKTKTAPRHRAAEPGHPAGKQFPSQSTG